MKRVLFNEPFNPSAIERLKFLYLYCDEVRVVDYSALLSDYAADSWKSLFSSEIFDEEAKKYARQYGLKDKNEIARFVARARAKSADQMSEVRSALDRVYKAHETYWAYLRGLAKQGFVTLEQLPTDFHIKRHTFDEVTARAAATAVSEDLRAWWLDYLSRGTPIGAFSETARTSIAGVIYLILAAHIMAAMGMQFQGYDIYTGEDAQIRAISRLVDVRKPASIRLGEAVVSVEVPNVRLAKFSDLAAVKEKLTDFRAAFTLEMGALTADLEKCEWNNAILEELRIRKQTKVDPILFDLRRQARGTIESLLKTHAHEVLDTALSVGSISMTLAVALGSSLNMGLLAALLGTEVGAIVGAMARASNEKNEIDKNHFAYIVRLEENL